MVKSSSEQWRLVETRNSRNMGWATPPPPEIHQSIHFLLSQYLKIKMSVHWIGIDCECNLALLFNIDTPTLLSHM